MPTYLLFRKVPRDSLADARVWVLCPLDLLLLHRLLCRSLKGTRKSFRITKECAWNWSLIICDRSAEIVTDLCIELWQIGQLYWYKTLIIVDRSLAKYLYTVFEKLSRFVHTGIPDKISMG